MSKLKIEHGASKTRWVLLKTTIEEELSADIDALCRWSENDRKYVVNELLRFAITQAEEFQKYKVGLPTDAADSNRDAATVHADIKPVPTPTTRMSKEEPRHAS
ncbi:MAG: hypothetical protein ACYDBH_11595 [Acidobacteriaceae bacterium]